MTRTIDRSNCFILEAFDRTLWCAIAQAPLQVTDIEMLRAVLGLAADEDPKLEFIYALDDEEITAIVSSFGTFDPRQISDADLVVTISRWSGLYEIPYLVHTNYELPLLLDGRKKLAHMYGTYPPAVFFGEERFDHWVAEGALHREEVVEPFERPIGDFQGLRTVYYTPKGEEWRIPAHKLIKKASDKAGGWNEHFERLEGMLFGYEDWQNDWWIKSRLERRALGDATRAMSIHREANSSENDRRFDVELLIVHPTIDPSEITMALGLEPKFSHRVGDPKMAPTRTPIVEGNYPDTQWRHSARYTVSHQWFAGRIAGRIESLVAHLLPHKAFLSCLLQTGGKLTLIVQFLGDGYFGDEMPQSILAKIADLGLSLGIECFMVPQSDQPK
jgi:hypothetical protein